MFIVNQIHTNYNLFVIGTAYLIRTYLRINALVFNLTNQTSNHLGDKIYGNCLVCDFSVLL